FAECDVSDAAATARAIDEVAAKLGGIDVLFANAGIANFGPLGTMDPAQFRRVFEVNCFGVFHAVRAALPHLVRSRGYALLNASASALLAPPGFGAYGPSKAAVESLGDVLRQEVRHLGVDVGVTYFGFTATDMVGAAEELFPAFARVVERLPG